MNMASLKTDNAYFRKISTTTATILHDTDKK